MLQAFIDYCRLLPNKFMYLIGIDKAEQDAKGLRYNLLRELFHFAGGVAISSLGLLLPLWANLLLSLSAYTFVMYGEVQDIRKGQKTVKSLVDNVAWLLGFSIPLFLRIYF